MAGYAGYTPYQKGIIKRYYEHADTLALQNLAEVISDLYMADTEAKKKKLWQKADAALVKLNAYTPRREKVVSDRDLEGLAKFLTDLQKAL